MDVKKKLSMYVIKFAGERLRQDLKKKELVAAPKLAVLEQKFDEAREAGLLLPSGEYLCYSLGLK